jgi:superfamily II DNA/RNA helicase
MDILISTPKRFSKLYFLNGINLSELQLIMVDDADFLTRGTAHTDIDRLAESLKKCQFVVFTDNYTPRYDRLKDLFMKNAELISV